MKKLIDDRPSGIYSDQDGFFRSEYQIGARLVWVRCQHRRDCIECVARVDELLPEIFAAMPSAVALAESHSRTIVPEFWTKHDTSLREGSRMDVWGITITPGLEMAWFDISRNHDFDYVSPTFSKDDCWNDEPFLLPAFPDRHHVYVVRFRDGSLSAEPDLKG
ncbi:hypothetical protein [Dyella jiangningensis]